MPAVGEVTGSPMNVPCPAESFGYALLMIVMY